MEIQRLEALRAFDVLDTEAEGSFDNITALVSKLFGAPISLVSLVDEHRQWFKSRCGLDATETPRDIAFCNIAIQSDEVFSVPDTATDPRFVDNPLVTGSPHIRAYHGAPLITKHGFRVGTLCAIYTEPHELSTEEQGQLSMLAKTVVDLLELRTQAKLSLAAAAAQHRLSDQIMAQSALLTEMSEMAAIGGWELDMKSNQVKWTDGTRKIHEVAPDFTPNLEDAINFYPAEQQEIVSQGIEKAVQDRVPFSHETQIITATNKRKWVRSVGRPVVRGGEVVKLYGAFQDITRDVEQKDALREERLRLASIIDATQVGTWEWDLPSGYVEYNDAWCEMLGYKKDEIDPNFKQWETLLNPEDMDETTNRLKAHLRGEEELYIATFRMRHKDGHWVWIRSTGAACVFDANGKPQRIVGVHTDATEEREREGRLRKQKIEAEAASVAKSQFLATMSHEIRTPMNGVMGMLNVLKESALTAHQRDCVETAYQSADSLLVILNDILDISKLEAGEVTLEFVPFSPAACVEGVVDLFRAKAQEKGIELKTDLRLPPQMKGDPTRCRQITANLVSNAIKFTHEGSVTVKMWHDEDEKSVTLQVSDTGIGMEPEFRDRVFERFSQADPSHARRYGGTGLGMAICKQLADAMGGELSCESEVGKGTTFTLKIIGRQAVEGQPTPAPEAPAPQVALEDLPPLRILAVDDQPVNLKILDAYLSSRNHKITAVTSGLEAIQALDHGTFDVILMDIQMPEMDGTAAMKIIRGRSTGDCNTPIIALTANAMKGDEEVYLEAGANGYVTKPVKPDTLFNTIALVVQSTDFNARSKENAVAS